MKEENKAQELVRPFGMHIPDEYQEKFYEGIERDEHVAPPIKPVTVDENAAKKKLYLLLYVLVSDEDNVEDLYQYEFFKGTSYDVYEKIKNVMGDNNEVGLDVMKSRILVDSPKIRISTKCSIYSFMKNAITTGKVIDDSGFNIDEYYYEVDEEDEEEE